MTRAFSIAAWGISVLAVLGFNLVYVGSAAAQGIGVFPTKIDIPDTLRGGEYFRNLGLINGTDGDRIFHFEISGPIAPWVTITDPNDRTKAVDSITVPPGANGAVFVKLTVPDSVPNGTYGAEVTITSELLAAPVVSGTAASSAVAVGSIVAVDAVVSGTQRIGANVVDISVFDVEVGIPLRMKARIANSGNVRITPEVELSIIPQGGTAAGTTIDRKLFAQDPAPPDEVTDVDMVWDTTNALPGDYVGRVHVQFADLDLGSEDLPFKVLQRGALARSGVLESIALAGGAPRPGALARVQATFRNTGVVESRAIFVGDFYRDGTLVDHVTTPERLVLQGQPDIMEVFLQVPQPGRYTLRGKVNYEGRETEEKELTFEVAEPGAGPPPWLWAVGGTLGALLVIGIGAAAVVLTNRRRVAR